MKEGHTFKFKHVEEDDTIFTAVVYNGKVDCYWEEGGEEKSLLQEYGVAEAQKYLDHNIWVVEEV